MHDQIGKYDRYLSSLRQRNHRIAPPSAILRGSGLLEHDDVVIKSLHTQDLINACR